jgi:hypothetical protein
MNLFKSTWEAGQSSNLVPRLVPAMIPALKGVGGLHHQEQEDGIFLYLFPWLLG